MEISLTNVHLDLGAGKRGTDMGPSAIQLAGLVPKIESLGHQVESIQSLGVQHFDALDPVDAGARFINEISETCRQIAARTEAAVDSGRVPLVIGGDHSQAIGTIAGMARALRKRDEKLGVLWVDAHTDMNTPGSSPSGNIHGMPLAALLGRGRDQLVSIAGETPALEPENVVIMGARDVDATEVPLVKELGVRVYTMHEIDSRGASVCIKEAIEHIQKNTAGIHLSFDLDGVDPAHAPGVGTPVPGGLSLRESHLLCESVASTGKLLGMEMVELNPILDNQNVTGELAVWLILSALGKRILGDTASPRSVK